MTDERGVPPAEWRRRYEELCAAVWGGGLAPRVSATLPPHEATVAAARLHARRYAEHGRVADLPWVPYGDLRPSLLDTDD